MVASEGWELGGRPTSRQRSAWTHDGLGDANDAEKVVASPCEKRQVVRDSSPRKPPDVHIDTEAAGPAAYEYPQLIKEYGDQWEWDPAAQDYTRTGHDGVKLYYTDYQTTGGRAAMAETSNDTHDYQTAGRMAETSNDTHGSASKIPPFHERATGPVSATAPSPLPDIPSYEKPLGQEFQVVTKPKRFFCIGRIFKTLWFEPSGADAPTRRRSNDAAQWSSKCPAFHGEKPVARFRWFVVVRRRLHHSLCFNITTFEEKGGKAIRGRPVDYVVLHSANIEPPRPYDDEHITRDPIAVIIEDETQHIAPIARLDCGRVYTIEDDLRVMKIGRVHPLALPLLDEYYKQIVS